MRIKNKKGTPVNVTKPGSATAAEAAVATKGVRGIIGTGAEIAFDTLKDLNNKYNKVTDDYTKDVMKNIKYKLL